MRSARASGFTLLEMLAVILLIGIAVAAVIAGGGEQLGEVQIIDEGSRYAYFKDTEGNIIGVYDSRR